MMRSIPIHTVDAFTDVPFTGNPAAVCYMMTPRSDAWMQQVAAEMNLAETAFFSHAKDGFHLRWFTPEVEVDLCGHATLATAHILWETQLVNPEEVIRFHTRSGVLTAARKGEWMELDFPLDTPREAVLSPEVVAALGGHPLAAAQGRSDLLVEYASVAEILALRPDLPAVAKLPHRGVVVTAPGEGEHDFVSRFFGPAVGIPEDPVTGSSHCLLAPYWSARWGRNPLTGYQASKRGGTVITEVVGERVKLRGKAVTVVQGVVL